LECWTSCPDDYLLLNIIKIGKNRLDHLNKLGFKYKFKYK